MHRPCTLEKQLSQLWSLFPWLLNSPTWTINSENDQLDLSECKPAIRNILSTYFGKAKRNTLFLKTSAQLPKIAMAIIVIKRVVPEVESFTTTCSSEQGQQSLTETQLPSYQPESVFCSKTHFHSIWIHLLPSAFRPKHRFTSNSQKTSNEQNLFPAMLFSAIEHPSAFPFCFISAPTLTYPHHTKKLHTFLPLHACFDLEWIDTTLIKSYKAHVVLC